MAFLLRLFLLLLLGLASLPAQDLEKVLPKQLPANPPAKAPAHPEIPEGPGGREKIIDRVRALVFVSGEAQIKKDGLPAFDGVRVGKGLPYLDTPAFRLKAEAFVGQPLTADTLNEITRAVVARYVAADHPVVDAVVPEQNIGNGVIQVTVIEGRVHEVRAKGNKWFNGHVLADELGFRPGDDIPQSTMVSRLNWMNQNPFRDVSAQFARGPETGTTDILLRTEDRFPVRFYTGYDNTGNYTTGQDRWNAGFNYGNFLGLDQQLNYQYTMSSDATRFNAHAGSYVIPLPWHHTVTLFGGYITTLGHPSGTTLSGVSWQASGRYNAGLPTLGNFTQGLTGGYDFKQSNNNLEFGGLQVFNTTTDVSQFVVGYNAGFHDDWGDTSLGLTAYLSPGDMTDNNTNRAFAATRSRANSEYVYGQANLTRVTKLPWNFSWIVKGAYQDASGNLVGSEQFGLGGDGTVRGYQEREANGDQGWLASTELRLPPFSLSRFFAPKFGTNVANDQLQFLVFTDYGWTRNVDLLPGEDANIYLWSVGPGFRYTLGKYATAKLDYGWQLTDTGLRDPDSSRGELSVTISY